MSTIESVIDAQLADNDEAAYNAVLDAAVEEAGVARITAIEAIQTSDAEVVETDDGRMVRRTSGETATSDSQDADAAADDGSADTDDVVPSALQDDETDGEPDSDSAARRPGIPTDDTFANLRKLEESDHPLIPDDVKYYRRKLVGRKTDIQCVTRALSGDTPDGAQNVLLRGPPGVGKNRMVEKICAQTNRPMVRIPLSRDIRYEHLVGHYSPDDDGDFEWQDGLLTMAVRYGWTVVFDEINMAGGDVTSALHQVTEDDATLTIRETGEVVDPDPRFKVVATMNPLGHAGTKTLNHAFESRFKPFEVDSLGKDAESKVIAAQVDGLDADDEDLAALLDFAEEIRAEHADGTIQKYVTTRHLIRCAADFADGFLSVENAVKNNIGMSMPENDRDAFDRVIEYQF